MIYYGYYSHIDGMFLVGITRFLYQRRVVMILETGIMIENAITYVKQIFAADSSGHDYHHTIRVYRLAVEIAKQENADMQIVQLAALLHDVTSIL